MKVRTVVNGTDYQDEILRVNDRLRKLAGMKLDFAEEDKRRAALRAELTRMQGLEPEPDRVEVTETGESYWDLWQACPASERASWLQR